MAHLQPLTGEHAPQVAALWNAACGPDLAISERFAAYNLHEAAGAVRAGRLAYVDGVPVGFIQVSTEQDRPARAGATQGAGDRLGAAQAAAAQPGAVQAGAGGAAGATRIGWVDAIAVVPQHQNQGLGSELLIWGEAWLAARGCSRARLGGGLRPFAPGLPVALERGDFFENRGYRFQRSEWDVARALSGGCIARALPPEVSARPAQPDDLPGLDAFLLREFSGRWRFEFQEFLREAGRPSDYFLLWADDVLAGFARLTVEDSERPIDRFYPHRLPRPWGQLGPLGVSARLRGRGYGGVLVSAALDQLRSQGVDGCIIDWTNLLDFYARFGFTPYRQYAVLLKALTPDG